MPTSSRCKGAWRDGTGTQADALAAGLGMHAAFGAPSLPPAPDPPETPAQADVDIGSGLLARWPITAAVPVELPAPAGRPTVALVATVQHPAGPLRVLVACLEWEPEYQAHRVAQARALADLAADSRLDGELPVFVLGDLNAAPGSPVLAPLHDVLFDRLDTRRRRSGGGHAELAASVRTARGDGAHRPAHRPCAGPCGSPGPAAGHRTSGCRGRADRRTPPVGPSSGRLRRRLVGVVNGGAAGAEVG